MAAYLKRVGKGGKVSWQAKVRLNGVYRSKTFATEDLARAWATSVEHSIYQVSRFSSVSICRGPSPTSLKIT